MWKVIDAELFLPDSHRFIRAISSFCSTIGICVVSSKKRLTVTSFFCFLITFWQQLFKLFSHFTSQKKIINKLLFGLLPPFWVAKIKSDLGRNKRAETKIKVIDMLVIFGHFCKFLTMIKRAKSLIDWLLAPLHALTGFGKFEIE